MHQYLWRTEPSYVKGRADQTKQTSAESKLFRSASPVGAGCIRGSIIGTYCIGAGVNIFYSTLHSFIFQTPSSISYLRLLPPYCVPLPRLLSPCYILFLFLFAVKTTTKCYLRFSFCSRNRLLILLTKRKKKRRRTKKLINIDRYRPTPLPNINHLPDPPLWTCVADPDTVDP